MIKTSGEIKPRSRNRLNFSEFKLNALLDITKAINDNEAVKKLYSRFEFILRNQLNIGKVILFSNNGNQWECVLKYGPVKHEKEFDVEQDILHIKEITMVESSAKDHLNHYDVVIPVYHKSLPLAYLLLGDMDEQAIKMSPIIKHLNFIQTLTNIIIVAIENKRLGKENIRQERMKKELELAKEMQSLLFPSFLPDNQSMQAAAYYQPFQQVGGDYYDLVELNEDEVLFCVADVSGKGISAALLMSNFQANLRAMANYKNSLSDIVTELNKKVLSNAKGEKFITMFIAKYNSKTRLLTYINAAHNPPLLRNGNIYEQLSDGCTGLGMFDKIPAISEGKVYINRNAVLVCYTDGVVELENESNEPFGIERLKTLIESNRNDSVKELNKKIVAELDTYKASMPYVDDVELFSFRFH